MSQTDPSNKSDLQQSVKTAPAIIKNRKMVKEPDFALASPLEPDEPDKQPPIGTAPLLPSDKLKAAEKKIIIPAEEHIEVKVKSSNKINALPLESEKPQTDNSVDESASSVTKIQESALNETNKASEKSAPVLKEAQPIKATEEAKTDDKIINEHEKIISDLVTSKKYFLPINAVQKRKAARMTLLGLIFSLVLILAWLDIALDAGLIHIGHIKALTHFFSPS